jgi:ADP-ribose pyrophosphatase YjhB (NUDIX family)
MLYDLLKRCVGLCFNLLNALLGGMLPPFASTCLVVEEDGRYLVVELPGRRIVFPGGFMKWRETPQQAAAREGHEETGMALQVGELFNVYSGHSRNWLGLSAVCLAFRGKVVSGELRASIEGRPYWLPEEELLSRLSGFSLVVFTDYQRHRAQHWKEAPRVVPIAP